MRILFVNKFFYLRGGSEQVFFQERNFMKNSGHSVVDFSMHDKKNIPSKYNQHFVPYIDYKQPGNLANKIRKAFNFIHSCEAVSKISEIIYKHRPQIAHLHNIYHQLTPSIISVLKKNGVKVVLTIHDGKLICPAYIMHNNQEGICTACEGKKFYKAMTNRCQGSVSKGLLLSAEAYWHKWKGSYDNVDHFISPSRFHAELVGGCRIPNHRITVLQNGIDTNSITPKYKDQGYILFFGRISKEKGIQTLLKAHSRLKKNMPLKIVGTGPMEKEMKLRFKGSEFLGYKLGEELTSLVNRASFVVVPSECYENCSMVVLEAMALGKAVIGARIGGIPEQIEDGKSGFLFEMGNIAELTSKMEKLIAEPNLRKKMGKLGRAIVEEKYSLERHFERLTNLYEYLLDNNYQDIQN